MRFKRVYIEITNICNLNCDFCKKHHRENRFMSYEEFEHILDEVQTVTKYIYLHVKGEPLLHPGCDELIKLAYQKGFYINLTTNATMLHNHLLITPYLRQINVSFHATNDEEIIKICKEIKDCIVNYRVWNFDENQEAIAIIKKEYGIQGEINKPNHTINENTFISVANQFEWPDIHKKIGMKKSEEYRHGYCHGLKDQLAILVDGTVVPCCLDDEGNMKLGNIFEQSLEDIINGERARRIIEGFQKRIAVEELCQKCSYKNQF